MILLNIFSLIIWLLVVPFCVGALILPLLKEQHRTPGIVLISGYIFQFALLELIGIPVVIYVTYNGFSTFLKIFIPSLVLLALLGVCIFVREHRKGYVFLKGSQNPLSALQEMGWEERLMLLLFLGLVIFQMYMAFTRASFDGDDAYYGVQALTAQQVDTLYRVNPYTGRSAPLDVRHALALFPIWEAFLGSASGVHATIICHSVVPLLLIPLTYVVYYQIGRILLKRRDERLTRSLTFLFMTLIALWQIFGNISLYTTETFFLTRTWQGKSFAGNFIIPATIWIFLKLYENEKEKGLWVLLLCLNFAGGASSSLAVLLSCLMTAGFGFLFAVGKRQIGIFVKACFCCAGGGIYVLLYLLLTHGLLGV